jgi:hypothetical protein
MVALFDDLFRAGLIESALAGGGSGVDPYGVDAH